MCPLSLLVRNTVATILKMVPLLERSKPLSLKKGYQIKQNMLP